MTGNYLGMFTHSLIMQGPMDMNRDPNDIFHTGNVLKSDSINDILGKQSVSQTFEELI